MWVGREFCVMVFGRAEIERERERETLDFRKCWLKTQLEVRTEMAAWSRVVPRRTCDTTGGQLVTLLWGFANCLSEQLLPGC